MWSPQHGYYTSDDARMIITPKTVDVTVTGAKTYGNNVVSGAEYASEAVKDSGKYAVEATGYIGDDTSDSVFPIRPSENGGSFNRHGEKVHLLNFRFVNIENC